MKVKVTDPCYVIDGDAWSDICDKAGSMPGDWSNNFDDLVTNYLKEKTGLAWVLAGGTGYGDWSNRMTGRPVIDGAFCADAGMWCVVPAEFNECTTDTDSFGGAAILEFDDGSDINVFVPRDNDRQWTEIEVRGIKDGYSACARSLTYEEENE